MVHVREFYIYRSRGFDHAIFAAFATAFCIAQLLPVLPVQELHVSRLVLDYTAGHTQLIDLWLPLDAVRHSSSIGSSVESEPRRSPHPLQTLYLHDAAEGHDVNTISIPSTGPGVPSRDRLGPRIAVLAHSERENGYIAYPA